MSVNHPDKVIVHCSATPDAMDIGAHEIDLWHKARGWKSIGYHAVIRRSGEIELGRYEWIMGAHTKGHNKNSLGICVVGTRDFTGFQISSLIDKLCEWVEKYELLPEQIYCHYQFTRSKSCPNIPVEIVRYLLSQAFALEESRSRILELEQRIVELAEPPILPKS